MRTQNKFSQLIIKITASCFVLILAVILFLPIGAQAQDLGTTIGENTGIVGSASGLDTGNTDLRVTVGRIIKVALGFVGTIALVLVLYGGYLYMISGGDPTKVDKAKKVLINAFIGLLIILLSYAIVSFIFRALTGEEQGRMLFSGLPPGYSLSGGAFGSVIVSHYPMPEQTGVPRNTLIMATFRMPITPESVIDTGAGDCPAALNQDGKVCGALRTDVVRIFRCADMPSWPADPERKLNNCVDLSIGLPAAANLVGGYAFFSEGRRSIVINPFGDTDTHLGDSEQEVTYIVNLSAGIQKENGDSIFSIGSPNGYFWRFSTSTVLDLIPPKLLSILPKNIQYPKDGARELDASGRVYLNQVVVLNFDEPMIPPVSQTQSGNAADAQNEVQLINETNLNLINCPENNTDNCLTVGENCPDGQTCVQQGTICAAGETFCETKSTAHIPGDWQVGLNGYRSVQFTSSIPCVGFGLNSCGEQARCLPPTSSITVFAKTAALEGPIALPTTGLMDAAGNAFDGNKNDRADGQGTFDYNALPAVPIYPIWDARPETDAILTIKESLQDDYYYRFLTGSNVDLTPPFIVGLEPSSGEGDLSLDMPLTIYWNEELEPYSMDTQIKLFGADGQGAPFDRWFDPNFGEKIDNNLPVADMAKVILTHGPFAAKVEGGASPLYTPVIKAQLKDSRQNCFTPSKDDAAPDASTIANSNCNSQIGEFPDFAGYSCCPQFTDGVSDGVLNGSTDPLCLVPHEPTPECQDSLDNDGDGVIDFAAGAGDSNCSSEWDDDESN